MWLCIQDERMFIDDCVTVYMLLCIHGDSLPVVVYPGWETGYTLLSSCLIIPAWRTTCVFVLLWTLMLMDLLMDCLSARFVRNQKLGNRARLAPGACRSVLACCQQHQRLAFDFHQRRWKDRRACRGSTTRVSKPFSLKLPKIRQVIIKTSMPSPSPSHVLPHHFFLVCRKCELRWFGTSSWQQTGGSDLTHSLASLSTVTRPADHEFQTCQHCPFLKTRELFQQHNAW